MGLNQLASKNGGTTPRSLTALGNAYQDSDRIAIHYVALEDLEDSFLEGNSKKHDIDKLVDSIRRYGFRDPVTFDPTLNNGNGGLIEGNGRLEALLRLKTNNIKPPKGVTENWQVPVVFGVSATSEAEAVAYSIEHNWSVAWGGEIDLDATLSMFDSDLLGQQVEYLRQEESLPLSFSEDLDEILDYFDNGDRDSETERAEVEEPPVPEQVEATVKRGQVWQLGRHRLACIDSTDETLVKEFLGDRKIELLFTSPPYADQRDYQPGTDVSLEKISSFIPCWASFASYQVVNLGLKFKDSAIDPYWNIFLEKAKESDLKLLAWNVWDRQHAGNIGQSTNMFFLTHEWLFVFGKVMKKLNRTIPNRLEEEALKKYGTTPEEYLKGFRSVNREKDGSLSNTSSKGYTHHQLHSVFTQFYEAGKIRELHPAVYPVKLPLAYIKAMTDPQDTIADCFLGSGTTLIAAEQSDRTCYGCELSEHYCDVIIARYEELTGEKAVLERTLNAD